MAKDESRVINSLLTLVSIFLVLLGLFFIFTGIRDAFFSPAQDVKTDNVEKMGSIDEGISTTRVPITPTKSPTQSTTTTSTNTNVTASAEKKAEQTAKTIQQTGKWVATNYVKGEIARGEYIVKQGDTLWEIAEAVYGNGAEWKKILAVNKDKIGFLKNGSQALIVPGQKLIIV